MASLRDIGYDLPAAVADLVDNSHRRRRPTGSRSTSSRDGAESWIRVSDDGLGMTPRRARRGDAIREPHATTSEQALGHFGLGLKTASLSAVPSTHVASRGADGGRIAVRRWDLDEVIERDSWDLERLPAPAAGDRRHRSAERRSTGDGGAVGGARSGRCPGRPTRGHDGARAAHGVRRRCASTSRWCSTASSTGRRSTGDVASSHRRRRAGRRRGIRSRATSRTRRSSRPRSSSTRTRTDRTIAVEVRPYVLPGQQLFSTPEAHRRARRPQAVEPPPGLLRLPARSADPGRRLEPAPDPRRARETRAHRTRTSRSVTRIASRWTWRRCAWRSPRSCDRACGRSPLPRSVLRRSATATTSRRARMRNRLPTRTRAPRRSASAATGRRS